MVTITVCALQTINFLDREQHRDCDDAMRNESMCAVKSRHKTGRFVMSVIAVSLPLLMTGCTASYQKHSVALAAAAAPVVSGAAAAC